MTDPISILSWVAAISALTALAWIAVSDFTRYRIPNLACAIIFLAGILALAVRTPPNWWIVLAIVGVTVGLSVGIWVAGFMGGGDAKLYMAASVWLDLDHIVMFVVVMAVTGLVLSIVAVLWPSHFRRNQPPAATDVGDSGNAKRSKSRPMVPYGVAIAVGAAAVIVNRQVSL